MDEPERAMIDPCSPSEAPPSPAPPNHQNILRVIAFETREQFSGPLPHPKLLAQYDLVLPGAADRILCMAENQQRHRMSLEKTVIEAESRRATHGLFAGGIIAALAVLCGTYLIAAGQNANGLAVILTPLAGLVGVFIYAERQRRDERERRMKAADQPAAKPQANEGPSTQTKRPKKKGR